MTEYKVPKECQKIIDRFFQGSSETRKMWSNWNDIRDAMIYMYRSLKEK